MLYNCKTLGVSEIDIIDIMENVAGQLISQEHDMRENCVRRQPLQAENGCRKAYGALRYARLMSWNSAASLLSQIRWGQEAGVIRLSGKLAVYELMLGMQKRNLESLSGKNLSGVQLELARARYLQERLPELEED